MWSGDLSSLKTNGYQGVARYISNYLLIHKSSTNHQRLDLKVFFVEMFLFFFFVVTILDYHLSPSGKKLLTIQTRLNDKKKDITL